jgi:hypothetical protein
VELAKELAMELAMELALELASVAAASTIDLTMLNWSTTCSSLKALAAVGSASYQSGLEKKVVVVW